MGGENDGVDQAASKERGVDMDVKKTEGKKKTLLEEVMGILYGNEEEEEETPEEVTDKATEEGE